MRQHAPGSRAACVLAAWLLSAPIGAGADPFEQTFAVEPDVRVEIEVLSGRIELRGIDANEVRVRAKGGIEVEGSRRRVTLRAPSRRGWRGWSRPAEVELHVELPRRSRIRVRSVNGSIRAEDVEGELSLHAANGKIEVRGAPREAYLETMTSAIEFEGAGSPVVARTLNGEIDLKGVAGDVEVHSVTGRIRVQGDAIERAELRTMTGEIELDASLAEGARVQARSYSGPVRLRLPAGSSARFDVQSFSGEVASAFAPQPGEGERHGARWRYDAGRHLTFAVGDGDARISIESFSGDVKIEEGGD